jgi:hypothetical protein
VEMALVVMFVPDQLHIVSFQVLKRISSVIWPRNSNIDADGFDGADKIFMIDFSMPMDGNSGFNGDMPALWILNADIPRTAQYGPEDCNCWSSGCGE